MKCVIGVHPVLNAPELVKFTQVSALIAFAQKLTTVEPLLKDTPETRTPP